MPFQKGVSGNKNGRPKKGQAFPDMIEKAIKKLKTEYKDSDGNPIEVKGKMVLANAIVELATNDIYPPQVRLQALKEIFDRTDGKPVQAVEMSADIESTVRNSTNQLKENIDKLTPEERDLYLELCDKVNEDTMVE